VGTKSGCGGERLTSRAGAIANSVHLFNKPRGQVNAPCEGSERTCNVLDVVWETTPPFKRGLRLHIGMWIAGRSMARSI
jgi:hypothetical protein